MYISKSVFAVLAALVLGLGGGYVLWGAGSPSSVNTNSGQPVAVSSSQASLSEADVHGIIEEYIIQNPVVIMQSVDDFQRNGFARQMEDKAREFVGLLEATEGAAIVGAVNAEVKIVEFFDYQCPHCKANYPVLQRLLAEDPTIALLPKHLPILGDGSNSDMSLYAAKIAESARLQGKFAAFHEALMARDVPLSRASIIQTAKDVGLDTEKLVADAESESVKKVVEDSREIAREIGIMQAGTPGYIIGGKIMIGAGADAYDRLKSLVEEARAS